MKILSFDCSSICASVCLTEDLNIIAQTFQNNGLTHSKTLLPMAESMLLNCGQAIEDIDIFAISNGPGSFTGLRIGVSIVKGLAFPLNKPCIGVSTLEATAHGVYNVNSNICCVMDARAGQVYQAFFKYENENLIRLCDDRAISLDELANEIKDSPQLIVGDGASLCYNTLKPMCKNIKLAPINIRFTCAYGVTKAAINFLKTQKPVDAQELDVFYIRPPYISKPKKQKI